MGPAATVDLMYKIVSITDADRDQDHVPMIVDNSTQVPDRTNAILHGGEDPVPELLNGAARLTAGGADFIIIPCNTSHYFYDRIAAGCKIPVLNMIQETVRKLQAKGIKCAAVLATDGTVKSDIYGKAMREAGIEPVYPDDEQQKQVMSMIYDYVKGGIKDKNRLPVDDFSRMVDDLKNRGAEAMVLACTELPLAFKWMQLDMSECIDTTEVLAEAAIHYAGARTKYDKETEETI